MSLFGPIENMDFGMELFDRIELCSMTKPKRSDGYYHVEHEGKGIKQTPFSNLFKTDSYSLTYTV